MESYVEKENIDMEFTAKQKDLMENENPEIVLSLEGLEIMAFFSLGQMHGKVVRMTDSFFGNTKIGVFTIDDLNGNTDLDFSNPDDWLKVEIKTIKLSLSGSTEWGTFKDTYSSLIDIKKIELFKQ